MYRFFLAANIWCPVAEYALMRVLSDPSVFLAWASLCSLVFPLLERWQRIDLISSKADGIQNEFLPLAGKRSWDKSRVAGRGRASVLMDSLMRSLSTAQRLTVRLSRPLLVSPNLLHQQPNPSLVLDGPEESREATWWWNDPREKNSVQCLRLSAWFIFFFRCLFHKQECWVLTSAALLSDGGTRHQILPHCQQ